MIGVEGDQMGGRRPGVYVPGNDSARRMTTEVAHGKDEVFENEGGNRWF